MLQILGWSCSEQEVGPDAFKWSFQIFFFLSKFCVLINEGISCDHVQKRNLWFLLGKELISAEPELEYIDLYEKLLNPEPADVLQ